MAVDILAWNLADGLSDKDRATGIVKVVEAQQPTAAVFSEAWQQGEEKVLDGVLKEFQDFGYEVIAVPYEDTEARDDRHGMLGLVRTEAFNASRPSGPISMLSRSAIHLSMIDPKSNIPFDFFGVHLNDRNEDSRLEQAHALLDIAGDVDPVIIGGDFNAMYRRGAWPRTLHLIGPLFQPVPEINYAPGYKPPRLHFVGDVFRRAGEMAEGTTLSTFREAGFWDTHPKHRPTIGPFNLDHILVRDLRVIDQQTHPKTPHSDHHAISAVLVV